MGKMYLHFWCLSPAVAFKEIAQTSHSVILTSGTLSPLDAMAYELKCDFKQRLVADHVIAKGQVLVTAIDRGINGNQLKMVYNNVKSPIVQDDVGLSLLSLFSSIPQGIVVFFSSYGTMQNMIKLYTEPRGSNELATQEFMEAIETFGRDCG